MERESFEDEATARHPERPLRRDQGRSRGAPRPRPDLHGRGPGDDRRRRLADVGVPDARGGGRSTAAPTSPDEPRHGCRRSARCSKGRGAPGASSAPRSRPAGGRLVEALVEQQAAGRATDPTPPFLDGLSADRGLVRPVQRRLGQAPQVPAADDHRVPAAAARGDRRPRPLAMARRPLDAMADGGIRDQLGGGFHRYATDAAGWCRTSSRCSTTTPSWRGSTSTPGADRRRALPRGRDRDARLHDPRADDRRRRLRREPGRRHRWHRRADVHVAADEIREVLGDDAELFGRPTA